MRHQTTRPHVCCCSSARPPGSEHRQARGSARPLTRCWRRPWRPQAASRWTWPRASPTTPRSQRLRVRARVEHQGRNLLASERDGASSPASWRPSRRPTGRAEASKGWRVMRRTPLRRLHRCWGWARDGGVALRDQALREWPPSLRLAPGRPITLIGATCSTRTCRSAPRPASGELANQGSPRDRAPPVGPFPRPWGRHALRSAIISVSPGRRCSALRRPAAEARAIFVAGARKKSCCVLAWPGARRRSNVARSPGAQQDAARC